MLKYYLIFVVGNLLQLVMYSLSLTVKNFGSSYRLLNKYINATYIYFFPHNTYIRDCSSDKSAAFIIRIFITNDDYYSLLYDLSDFQKQRLQIIQNPAALNKKENSHISL